MRLRLHRPLPEGQPLVIRITRTPRRVVASLVYVHVDPQPAEAATERRWASMLALQSASPCLTTAATSTDASWTGASSVAYSAAWHEQSADPPDVARKSRRWLESGSASPSTTVVTSTKWPRPLMRQANARAGHHLYQGLARRLQNPPPCSTQSRHRWPACPRAAQSLKQRNPATAAAGFRRGGLSRRPTSVRRAIIGLIAQRNVHHLAPVYATAPLLILTGLDQYRRVKTLPASTGTCSTFSKTPRDRLRASVALHPVVLYNT